MRIAIFEEFGSRIKNQFSDGQDKLDWTEFSVARPVNCPDDLLRFPISGRYPSRRKATVCHHDPTSCVIDLYHRVATHSIKIRITTHEPIINSDGKL